jgi:hypothetical protein
MPDLYDQIASGSYGRSSDRWYREPDFEDTIDAIDEEDDESDLDLSAFDEFDEDVDE